jgi:hypothetical protein
MKIKVTSMFDTKGNQVELERYVAAKLDEGYADGLVERAEEKARNAAEALASLMNVLAEKGVISLDEVQKVINSFDTIVEVK